MSSISTSLSLSEAKSKIFFASDFHLGSPDAAVSRIREKKIVSWLDEFEPEMKELVLLGDIFDFWFEYRHSVPKGYVRLLGKLAELADRGVAVTIFTGNHDLWMKDYLTDEIGAVIHHDPVIRKIDGKTFYLAHGDGLGPGDKGFKFIKRVFTNPFSQWLYSRIHPNTGIAMANYFSGKSRHATGGSDAVFLGEEKEWLIVHSKEILKEIPVDYFIYGHRHLPLDLALNQQSRYINLGDWIKHNTYAVWDGNNLKLEKYKTED
jgi:UDP-2,3-diacylglucosamine hydrolase